MTLRQRYRRWKQERAAREARATLDGWYAQVKPQEVWVWLHTGDPGPLGVDNMAAVRPQPTPVNVGAGRVANAATLEWPPAEHERYTYASVRLADGSHAASVKLWPDVPDGDGLRFGPGDLGIGI